MTSKKLQMLKEDLSDYINHKEQTLQDKIARGNGIDPDFSCDIVPEDYLPEDDEEIQEINTLKKALEIAEKESEV